MLEVTKQKKYFKTPNQGEASLMNKTDEFLTLVNLCG